MLVCMFDQVGRHCTRRAIMVGLTWLGSCWTPALTSTCEVWTTILRCTTLPSTVTPRCVTCRVTFWRYSQFVLRYWHQRA